MSRSIKSNKRVVPEVRKPFCKVCQDAGLSETVFSSHFVKDTEGKVICPTLLNQECRYCFKIGHTVKFCPILAEQAKEEKKIEARVARVEAQRVEEEKKKSAPKSKPTSKNVFAALDDSSDEEEVRVAPKPVATKKSQLPPPKPQATLVKKDEFPALAALRKESEFPALSPNVTLRPHQRAYAQVAPISYANTLQMAPPVKVEPIPYLKPTKVAPAKKAVVVEEVWSDDEEYIESQLAAQEPPKPFYQVRANWADYSDDEDW
jgi:Nanos RNA binding domain